MNKSQADFLIYMMNMSATVLEMAIGNTERKPDDLERRDECHKAILSTAADLRKLAASDTVGWPRNS